jgi:6-phosphogluconolactonase
VIDTGSIHCDTFSKLVNLLLQENMQRQVEILPDRPAIVSRALEIVVKAYERAIARSGRFTIAVAGGSTPKPLYEALATQLLDWSKVHVFWGDERYVPASDPQSNEGMTRKAWLDRVSMPPGNIHAMPTDADDPAIAAQTYEEHLQEFFGVKADEFPSFDLILLGIGDDGHTASLFPGTPALTVSDRLITVGQKDSQPRLTFTAPLINQAELILFLVDGIDKANALKAILATEGDANIYPARLIQGNNTWLVDRSAGSALSESV